METTQSEFFKKRKTNEKRLRELWDSVKYANHRESQSEEREREKGIEDASD